MDDKPVTLPEMLDAREKRGAYRNKYFRTAPPGNSLLQISVNIPGEIKNSEMIRSIYREAVRSLIKAIPEAELLPESSEDRKTGPEAYLSLHAEAEEMKRRTCLLEEQHILGRLWDIDVFTDPNHSLSRSEIGFPERSCYLCGRPAHECSRSKRHSLDGIEAHIRNLYQHYSTESSQEEYNI